MNSSDQTPRGSLPDNRSLGAVLRSLLPVLLSRPGHSGPLSDHFDGRRFRNLDHPQAHGLLGFLRWRLGRLLGGAGRWPAWIAAAPGPAPPARVDGKGLRVTFVNNATVLLQTAGLNVLTDPIWSERASPVAWAGPRRHRPPGLRFADLPPVDVVLLSHNHYDHLDLPTLRALARAHAPRIFTGLGNAALLAREGVGRATELDWWQEAPLPGALRLSCVPARHFSGRGLWDRNRTLWCGFVLPGPTGPVYFAGDTAFGSHFEQIAGRFGAPRLALLPVGGYLPRWFMGRVHLSPPEAVRAHQILGARLSVAIHFDTFALADEGHGQALADLQTALVQTPEAASGFRVLQAGLGEDVPELPDAGTLQGETG
jgi:L-ascorbate metabolism protein UlaG (beta-lactamase superfamily)